MGDGPKNDEDSGDEVIVRRIDKRLAKRDETDLPWLRRIVGFAIIIGAFWYGWTMMNQKSAELIQQTKREAALSRVSPTTDTSKTSSSLIPLPGPQDSKAPPEKSPPAVAVLLDPQSLTTISECTKGVNAFRGLDLNASVAASGTASLESVLKPVLVARKGLVRRSIQLQNIRIKTKTGEELRLHAAPKTQGGDLYMSLFRVAGDGLPEEVPFPKELAELKEKKVDEASIAKFLTLSETPGHALAIERHEAWSFPEKNGLQIIFGDDLIYDLQVFMPDRFLACSRGVRADAPAVICKCVQRGSRP